MKNIHLVLFLLAASSPCLAANEALEAVKNGPAVICKDHPEQMNCQNAINNLIVAIKNVSHLNDACEATSPELKGKMDESARKQCETAKEITDYISTMPLKR